MPQCVSTCLQILKPAMNNGTMNMDPIPSSNGQLGRALSNVDN